MPRERDRTGKGDPMTEPHARDRADHATESEREEGAGEVRVVSSSELLGASRVIRIEHRGSLYTLRITKHDRLILTK